LVGGFEWLLDSDLFQIQESQREFELIDEFEFRSPGRRLMAGPPPEARPQGLRVARDLALALKIQGEMDREGLASRQVAARYRCSHVRICKLLLLTRLAPEIQDALMRMTKVTAAEPIPRKALGWVAEAADWDEQRARFATLAPT
jgi:hypothetical protein